MCRSIKRLHYPPQRSEAPPTTPEEVRAAALQFVRKISGYRVPSKANTDAFDRAVERITADAEELLSALR